MSEDMFETSRFVRRVMRRGMDIDLGTLTMDRGGMSAAVVSYPSGSYMATLRKPFRRSPVLYVDGSLPEGVAKDAVTANVIIADEVFLHFYMPVN